MKKITIITPFARGIAVFFILIILSGCHSRSTLTNIPPNSDTLIIIDKTNKTKLSAFVSNINVENKNKTEDTSSTTNFDKRFLSHLKDSNYFSDVIYGIYSKKPENKHIELSLNVNQNLDLHNGKNATKAFFTGFTLFLLAPFLPATYDFDSNYTLLATGASGIQREYKASCGATASGTWPYISAVKKFSQSLVDASDKCLNSVINQLTSDGAK